MLKLSNAEITHIKKLLVDWGFIGVGFGKRDKRNPMTAQKSLREVLRAGRWKSISQKDWYYVEVCRKGKVWYKKNDLHWPVLA